MIQDTAFVLDLLNGDENAVETLRLIEQESRPQKLSAMTALELHEGVVRANHPEEERRAVLDVLDSKTILPADRTVMKRAGEISGSLFERGLQIGREDCVIAATALLEGEPVLTRDADHYERVDGLDVWSY